MSKLADQLRGLKVFNNHELLRRFGRGLDVVIEYHRPAPGRLGWCDTHKSTVWSVSRNPRLESPKRALSVAGEKEFHGVRRESLPAALAWARNEFGHDYVASPFGGYIPQHTRHHAEMAVKKART